MSLGHASTTGSAGAVLGFALGMTVADGGGTSVAPASLCSVSFERLEVHPQIRDAASAVAQSLMNLSRLDALLPQRVRKNCTI
jgi:hypothetical protein